MIQPISYNLGLQSQDISKDFEVETQFFLRGRDLLAKTFTPSHLDILTLRPECRNVQFLEVSSRAVFIGIDCKRNSVDRH